jgi:hypothetical protein
MAIMKVSLDKVFRGKANAKTELTRANAEVNALFK